MVTRNPNWSTEILWYMIGYTKRKMLSPLKRPTWDRLHCWFCLKLLRISLFLFFLSCSWLWHQWTVSTNISNSGVRKYCTNPKRIRYSWIYCQWLISQRIEFEEEFSYAISCCLPFYYYLPFLDGNKRNVAQQILHLTVMVHILGT